MNFLRAYAAAAARWPGGHRSLELDTSWGRTHVLEAGAGDAPPVVLLHGDGATATAWASVAAELSGNFRVLAPDQPGNPGRSSISRPFRTTSDLVSWLGELLAETSGGPVHLAGHSAGAHLALSYALERPDRLVSLSLLDPTFCFAGLSPRYLLHALPILVRPTPPRVRRFLGWEAQGRVLEPRWLEAYVQGATAFDRTPIVRTRRPRTERLTGLRVPLLVVLAGLSRAHDPVRIAHGVGSTLPAATVVDIPEATHHTMPVLDADVLAAAMAAHIAGTARS